MIVDKPVGPTSHDAVAVVRRATGIRRVGHAGTLDPFASGVLPVLIGRATRLMRFLVGLAKQYVGTIRLGITTDTDDRTGSVLRIDDRWQSVSETELATAFTTLTGPQSQVPPVYSAKKISGVPAHRRARRGQDVTLAPRAVAVHAFRCTGREGADIHFSATVSSGTYVRALARDLGDHLGCGAHLTALRRTAVGLWEEGEAVALDRITTPFRPQPPLAAVRHLPHRPVDAAEAAAVRHGRSVPAGDAPDGPTALVSDGGLLAIAERRGDILVPCVVLAG